jgi:hypothetical protein
MSIPPLVSGIFIRFRGPTAHHDRAKKRALRYKVVISFFWQGFLIVPHPARAG